MEDLDAVRARRTARRLADRQAGIVTRAQLYRAGVPRWLVRRELRTGRWQRAGRRTVAVHNGPLGVDARRWTAVLEVGRRAALAGVTALQVAGARGLDEELVHVITPKGSAPPRLPGVVVHESRRWRDEDVVRVGIPRVRPAVAAVHAGLWARTERQAVFFVVLAVQQGVATAAQVAQAVDAVRRSAHRRALLRVVEELEGGVRSLGELDVGRAMRGRGLPEPDRQRVLRRPSGVQYLDADFAAYGITLEVDGWQHDEAAHRLSDLIRDLALTADGRAVVRLPLVVWRLDETAVLDALERLFRSRGWTGPAQAA